jgi:chromate transporter
MKNESAVIPLATPAAAPAGPVTARTRMLGEFRARWRELAQVFLKLGTMSYGGTAMVGIVQADLQEKRGWLSKESFLEGWALVNLLPGATMLEFCLYIGYRRAGWLGAVLAGLCFTVPAFFIMLGLTLLYDSYGTLPVLRHAFYGVGPVVLGFFIIAVYRLGKAAFKDWRDILVGVAAAAALAVSPLGIVMTMVLGGCAGVAMFHSRTRGLLAAVATLALFALFHYGGDVPAPLAAFSSRVVARPPGAPGLWDVGAFFFKVGALATGGGLTTLAFIQNQVVDQLHWLTPREFLDGLVLGQLTPGPILMVAAYVGYRVGGVFGAAIGGLAIFLPAFLWMLSVLPILGYFKDLLWIKKAMRGVTAAVIGIIAVSLLRMAPNAAPDLFAAALGVLTITLLLWRPVGPFPLMLGGALLGVARMTVLGGG